VVNAETVPASVPGYQVFGKPLTLASTQLQACQNLQVKYPDAVSSQFDRPFISGGSCAYMWVGYGSSYSTFGTLELVMSCPTGQGWVLSGSSCTRPDCPGGEFHDPTQGGACKKDCSGKSGMATASGQYSTNVDSWTGTVSGCQVKCSAIMSLVVSASTVAIMKNCTYTGKTAQSGDSSLEAEAAPNPNEPPKSIKGCAGAGMGYVQSSSGVVTCVASQDAPEGQKPTIKDKGSKESGTDGNGDGKADPTSPDYKKTDTETSKSGDNVTTKKTETVAGTVDGNGNVTCPAGYTKNADNTCSKTTVSTQSSNSFCEENPNSEQCKGAKKSTFNGSCTAGFTCDGDAATCAIARASWESRCAMQSDATTSLFDSDSPGGTAAQQLNADKALNKDGSGDWNVWTAFQQNQHNYFTITSSCPVTPVEVPLPNGAHLTLDPTLVCQIGEFIRLLVHIFAYMALIRLFATKLV